MPSWVEWLMFRCNELKGGVTSGEEEHEETNRKRGNCGKSANLYQER